MKFRLVLLLPLSFFSYLNDFHLLFMSVLSQKRLLPLRIYDALLVMAEGKPFCNIT